MGCCAQRFHSSPTTQSRYGSPAQINKSELTDMAWEGIIGAVNAARLNKQQIVETDPLMKALLQQKDGLARRLFTKAGIDNTIVLQATEKFISEQPKVVGDTRSILGPNFVALLNNAKKHKKDFGDDYVSIEHLLLAFYSDKRFGRKLFKKLPLSEKDLKDAIMSVRGKQRVTDTRATNGAMNEKNLVEFRKSEKSLLREEVTDLATAEIISKRTGIPVSNLQQSEWDKLVLLEEVLHNRVVGQDIAVKSVANAICCSRQGISDPNRPIASFMFMGPKGVGKTELAKALAEYLFNTENALTRLYMSEYMEKHAVSRLFGAPPGYVGYEEGGQLTEAVRQRPCSAVLFEELEKAHHDVFNIVFRLLDEGRLTDSHGRTVNFTNCVIIMTSNIGSHLILDTLRTTHDTNDAVYEVMKKQVVELARQTFCPKFMNEIDEYILFQPLDSKEIKPIVGIQLNLVKERLKQKKIDFHFTHKAVEELLAALGYNHNYEARAVKKVIQQNVGSDVALGYLRGDFKEEDSIIVDAVPPEASKDLPPNKRLIIRKLEKAPSGDALAAND